MARSPLIALLLYLQCININATSVWFMDFYIPPKNQQDRNLNALRDCLKNKTLKLRFPAFGTRNKLLSTVVHKAPGPVVLMKDVRPTGILMEGLNNKDLWLTLALCVVWATISGIIIWIFEHKRNSDEFPKSFLQGAQEGAWWALVTMTTVGYGDKAPKTLLARMYSAVWMIAGMMLLSMLTAKMSSTVTTKEVKSERESIRRVGIPRGFFNDFDDEDLPHFFDVEEEYDNQSALEEALRADDVNAIITYYCSENITVKNYKVVKEITFPRHAIGICVTPENESKCMDLTEDYDNDTERVLKCLNKTIARAARTKGIKNNEILSNKTCRKRFRKKQPQYQDFSFSYYLLAGSVGVLVLLLTLGTILSRFHYRVADHEVPDQLPMNKVEGIPPV